MPGYGPQYSTLEMFGLRKLWITWARLAWYYFRFIILLSGKLLHTLVLKFTLLPHLFISNRALTFQSRSSQYSLFFGMAIGLYFVYHSYTTFFVKMDYGYNMLINIAFGRKHHKWDWSITVNFT